MSTDPDSSFCALIIMGVSGSGKSTIADALARRLGWIVEDADPFHSKNNIEKMSAGIALTDEDRWSWLRARRRGDRAQPRKRHEHHHGLLRAQTRLS